MRSTFRKDLPLYELPEKKKRPVKRNLLNENAPAYKTETEPKGKRRCYVPKSAPQPKSVKLQMTIKTVKLWGFIDLQHHVMNGQTIGTTQWMKHGNDKHANCWIRFVRPFQRQEGESDMILTRPDMRSLRSIGGDGNCLFRALCYIISGSEAKHG